MGDWTDLVGKAVDHLNILDANVENPQTTHNLWDEFKTVAREIPLIGGTLVTPNHLTYGVSWRFGGQWQGHGRYIRDAFAWVNVHGIGAAQRFSVAANWNDLEWEGTEDEPVAVITCDMTVTWEQFYMTDSSWHLHFILKGDGSGSWVYGAG
jgi:hypothetical protein